METLIGFIILIGMGILMGVGGVVLFFIGLVLINPELAAIVLVYMGLGKILFAFIGNALQK